jgi:hypothetical protein
LTQTLIASIERAGDHVAVVGALALVAAVVGLVYVLVQVAGRRRADRTESSDRSGGAWPPGA